MSPSLWKDEPVSPKGAEPFGSVDPKAAQEERSHPDHLPAIIVGRQPREGTAVRAPPIEPLIPSLRVDLG